MTDPAPRLPSRLIQLVARFRPDADGVGETALRVADVLSADFGIPSDFLVYNPPRADHVLDIPEDFAHTVAELDAGGAAALASAIDRLWPATTEPPVLLLHYTSYAYSGQGTPTWLPPALERFKARGGHLLTLFHELYATPRLFSRTLFTSWLQKRIFRQILAASDAAFTSSGKFVGLAKRDNRAGRPIHQIGICSSAGEPANPRPLAQRSRRIAVFGRFSTRRRLYARHLPLLQRVAQHLGVEEIADIGAVEDLPWMKESVAGPLGSLLRCYGPLPIPEASRLFEDSIAGALAYPRNHLEKSSVTAAYQAHAAAVLLFPDESDADSADQNNWAVDPDEVLALPAQSEMLFGRLQQAADEAHRHYNRHRSARAMVATLIPALRSLTP